MAKKKKAVKKPAKKKWAKGKHPGGRPRIFDTPEQMQEAIDNYFKKDKRPTVCGLCIALGFTNRHALTNYEGYGKEFYATIKKAKFRIERFLEDNLYNNKPTGTIFNLKNNFGWQDKQEFEHSGSIDLLPPMITRSNG
ncbi:MAG: terminase small subunit [Phycisphaerae bacterium]|nr:terminase small subunit [Phycisphaerae bacterium]